MSARTSQPMLRIEAPCKEHKLGYCCRKRGAVPYSLYFLSDGVTTLDAALH